MFRAVAKSISNLENGGKKNLPLRRTFNAFATAARQGQLFGGARTRISSEPVKYFDVGIDHPDRHNLCAVLNENGSVDVFVKNTTEWLRIGLPPRGVPPTPAIVDLAVGTIGVVAIRSTSVSGFLIEGNSGIAEQGIHEDKNANFVKVATTNTPPNEDGDQLYRETVAVVDKLNNKILLKRMLMLL